MTVSADATEDQVRTLVLSHEPVKKFLDGQPVKQVIVVPKRLVNIVIGKAET
jgi:leucyl-tRNA synthetase